MQSIQKEQKFQSEEPASLQTHFQIPQNDQKQSLVKYCNFFKNLNMSNNIPCDSAEYAEGILNSTHKTNDSMKSELSEIQDIDKVLSQKIQMLKSSCINQLSYNQFHFWKPSQLYQNQQLHYAPFEINVVRNLSTWQVVEIYCHLGQICKKFIVLNSFQTLNDNDKMYHREVSLPGSPGTRIILLDWLQETYALKRIEFIPPLAQDQLVNQTNYFIGNKPSFRKVIKQYFIANIMSALKVGPYIKKINGFDFIVHDSFIEFHMEQCHQFHTSEFENQMKENLLKMHSLKICHNDIAPKNIMFSPTFNKSVFIDFGISNMVKEEIGKKTLTGFCGTYQFGSPQMQNLFMNNTDGFVNLYSNDVHGLQKSFVKFLQRDQKLLNKNKTSFEQQSNVCNTLLNKYMHLWQKLPSKLSEDKKKSDESAFKGLQGEKKFHKILSIQACKFLIYCQKNYFYNIPQYHFNIQKFQQLKISNITLMIETLNQELRTFTKMFDPFVNFKNIITAYKQFFTQSDQADYFIDIESQIQAIKKLYLPNSLINHKKTRLLRQLESKSFDIQLSVIYKFYDLQLVQQSIYDPKHIFQYLRFLFILADFTSSREFVTNDLREKVFKIYAIIRKQLLVRIKPTSPTHSTENHSKFYPNSLYSSQCIPEILQFYDDMLTVTLDSSESSLEENGPNEVKQLILRHGFQALKNLILLGFNCLQFIKQYLKNCLVFFIKTPGLRKHLVLIMIRQTIEVGLFLKHCDLVVEKGKNFLNISKHRLLNEEILKFQYDQEVKDLMEKDPVMKKKIEVIEEMWIFLNPEYAKIMLSYRHYFKFFKQMQLLLIHQFFNLNIDQMLRNLKIYEETLKIKRKYETLSYLTYKNNSKPQSQNVSNGNIQYEKILFRDQQTNLNIALNQTVIKLDSNLMMTINTPIDVKKRKLYLHKIIKKIKQISKLNNLSIFVFYQIRLEYSLLCYQSQKLQQFLIICYQQQFDMFSLIDSLLKTVFEIQKVDQYPFHLGEQFYLQLLCRFSKVLLNSIDFLILELQWGYKQINIYQISYVHIIIFLLYIVNYNSSFRQGKLYYSEQACIRKIFMMDPQDFQIKSFVTQLQKKIKINLSKFKQSNRMLLLHNYFQLRIKQAIYDNEYIIQFSILQQQFNNYLFNLNEFLKLTLKYILSGQHQVNHTILGSGYIQFWYLTIQNIILEYQYTYLSTRILKLVRSNVYKSINLNYYNKHSVLNQFQFITQFINQNSQIPEGVNNLINSLTYGLFYNTNYNYQINILDLQSKNKTIQEAVYLFKITSKTLSPQIIEFLVNNIIKSNYLPAQYIYFMYLYLFQDHRQMFNSKLKDKIMIIYLLFRKYNTQDLQYKNNFILCKLYFQYLIAISRLPIQNQQNNYFSRIYCPLKIFRKLIRYFTVKSSFNMNQIKILLRQYIDSLKYDDSELKSVKFKTTINNGLARKKLIYIAQQLIEFKNQNEFILYIKKRNPKKLYKQLSKLLNQQKKQNIQKQQNLFSGLENLKSINEKQQGYSTLQYTYPLEQQKQQYLQKFKQLYENKIFLNKEFQTISFSLPKIFLKYLSRVKTIIDQQRQKQIFLLKTPDNQIQVQKKANQSNPKNDYFQQYCKEKVIKFFKLKCDFYNQLEMQAMSSKQSLRLEMFYHKQFNVMLQEYLFNNYQL